MNNTLKKRKTNSTPSSNNTKNKKFDYHQKSFKVWIGCIIGAIFLYSAISITQRNEKIFNCKLKIEDLSNDLVITSNIPEYIKVTVKDKAKVLDNITEEDFNVRLNLSNINHADNYMLKVQWDIPKAITSFTNALLFSSIELNPTHLYVNLETLIQKTVPIQITTTGTIPSGYKIQDKSQDMYYARIQGPEKILQDISSIKTSAIDLTNQVDSFKQTVNLISPSNYVTFISKSSIETTFRIIKSVETTTFAYDKIELNNLKKHLQAQYNLDSNISVTLSGDKSDLQNLSKSSVIVSVNCSSISYQGEYSTRIEVSVPQNITIVSIKPDIVKLIITENDNVTPPPMISPPVIVE